MGSTESTIAQKPLIHLDRISKKYANRSILNDLSIEIELGEFLAIVGESGSGKSTLLKLIAGLERPSGGSISIRQQCQDRVAPHLRDIALVFQNANGYDHLTVNENLSLAGRSKDTSNGSTIQEWTDRLGLRSMLSQKLGELSGGQSQRVAIARAMLSGKSIVLLDEPLAHLNQSMRRELRSMLKESHRTTGKTFLYVTHDSEEAMQLATRVAVLDSGRFQQVGTARQIYETPTSISVSQLFGQQAMSIVKLPRELVAQTDPSRGDATTTNQIADHSCGGFALCGIRPHGWSIGAIRPVPGSIDHHQGAKTTSANFKRTPAGLQLTGRISECRWLGSVWQILVLLPNDSRHPGEEKSEEWKTGMTVELSSPNSPGNPLKGVLEQICTLGPPQIATWEVEAIVPFSDVQILSK